MNFKTKVVLVVFICIALTNFINVMADTGSFGGEAGTVYKLQSGTNDHATTYKETRTNYSACSAIGVYQSEYSTSSCAYLATTHATWWSIQSGYQHVHMNDGIPGISMQPGEIIDEVEYTYP